MSPPRHLWSGSWRRESDDASSSTEAPTLVADPTPREPEPQPAPEPTRPRRNPVLAAVVVGTLLLSAAVAYLVVDLTRDDGNSTKNAATVAPLPAAAGSGSANSKPATPGTTAAIYKAAGPAVASIRTSSGSGTGFLVSDRRTLVTNAHVVEGSSSVKIQFGTDGRTITGTVTGTDPSSDLAVVKIDSDPPADAKPLQFADSASLQVGAQVVAIGNPFGLDRTVTQGIISAVGREIQSPNGFAIENAIQTDAAINPGNSGGPLLDTEGRVVGVNSQIETGSGSNGNVGIGFAVPANAVRTIAPQLAAGQKVEHAWLGVSTQSTTTGGGSGAEIAQVVSGGPAESAGLKTGDTITAIDGKKISQFSDVAQAVDGKKPGEKVSLSLAGGRTVKVTLGNRPESASSAGGQQAPQIP